MSFGTTIAELVETSSITISGAEPVVTIENLDIEGPLTSPDADRYVGFRLDAVVRVDADEVESGEESVFAVSVNEKVAVQIIVRRSDDGLVATSTGWIEGAAEWALTDEATSISYSNYLQYDSSSPDLDTLTFSMRTDGGVEFDVLPSSSFVEDSAPGQATVIEVVDVDVANDDATVRVRYRLRSDRVTSAVVEIVDAQGLTAAHLKPERVDMANGEATGEITVGVSDGASLVSGVLVAATDFNDPAAPFSVSVRKERSTFWPLVAAPLLLAAVIGFIAHRRGLLGR